LFPGDCRRGVRPVVLLPVTAPATDAKSRTLSAIRWQRVPIGRGGSHRGSCLMTYTSSAVAIWELRAPDMTREQVIRIPTDRDIPLDVYTGIGVTALSTALSTALATGSNAARPAASTRMMPMMPQRSLCPNNAANSPNSEGARNETARPVVV